MTRRPCNYIDGFVCDYFAERYVKWYAVIAEAFGEISYATIAEAFCEISYTTITNGIYWGKYVAIEDEVL